MSRRRINFPDVVIGKLTLVKAIDVNYWRVRCACGRRFATHIGSARLSAMKSGGRFPRMKWRALRFHRKTRPIPASWRKSFMAFYEDVGPAPRGWDLTRHDVQGGRDGSDAHARCSACESTRTDGTRCAP